MIDHPTPSSPSNDEGHDVPQHVVISVDDHHLGDMDTVVAGLKGAGMVVEEVMTSIGMITGSVTTEAGTQTVQQVIGVASVQRQLTYRVPPPEADVQ